MNARKTAGDMVIKAIVSAEFMGESNPLSEEQLGLLIRSVYRYSNETLTIEDCAKLGNDSVVGICYSMLTSLIDEIVESWGKVG